MDIILTREHFLYLLQLTSPSLPVGAYGYSEGLEMLVENGTICDAVSLQDWLGAELVYGAIRLEGAVMVRAYDCLLRGDVQGLCAWNMWLSATREAQELRAASWQMGRSLGQLLVKLQPEIISFIDALGEPVNYAVVFTMAAAQAGINLPAAISGYLHSWLANLITAAVKLIPLGQTSGQELLLRLQPLLIVSVEEILALGDDDLSCCSWGLSLASMQHETQYTRLFRS